MQSLRGVGEGEPHYWLQDWRGYAEFFFSELLQRTALDETVRGLRRVGDGHRPGAMALADGLRSPRCRPSQTEALLRSVRCPVLAIHGVGTAASR